MIRLLLQKQSDLGLRCLSRPFGQATSVRNLRTFTVDLLGIIMSIFSSSHHFPLYSAVQLKNIDIKIETYCKNSIGGPCSYRVPFPSLDTKKVDFSSKLPKNQASNKGPPTNIEEKNRSYLIQKSLEFVIRCKFLVLCLLSYFAFNLLFLHL